MNRLTLIFAVAVFLSSCNQDDGDSVILPFIGKEYVSLRVGQEAIYQIDSTIYDEFYGTTNRLSLQQKEVVVAWKSMVEIEKRLLLKFIPEQQIPCLGASTE